MTIREALRRLLNRSPEGELALSTASPTASVASATTAAASTATASVTPPTTQSDVEMTASDERSRAGKSAALPTPARGTRFYSERFKGVKGPECTMRHCRAPAPMLCTGWAEFGDLEQWWLECSCPQHGTCLGFISTNSELFNEVIRQQGFGGDFVGFTSTPIITRPVNDDYLPDMKSRGTDT